MNLAHTPATALDAMLAHFWNVRTVNLEAITFADLSLSEQAQRMVEQAHFFPGFALPALIFAGLAAWRLHRGQPLKMPCSMVTALIWTALGAAIAFAWYMTGATGYSAIQIGPVFSIFLIAREVLHFMRLAPSEKYVPRLDGGSMFVITYLQLLAADIVIGLGVGMGITWLGGAGFEDALIRTPLVLAAIIVVATRLLVHVRSIDLANRRKHSGLLH